MTSPSIKYDVFLSFRGEDTRNNFTSHLHKALIDKRIQTFFDHNINKGDEITPSLLEAIEESRISVVIFSKNYASSTWCLDELVHILKCKKENSQIVIPVFHNIDPSEIRNRTGVIADDFKKHEDRYKDSLHKVQGWKDALKEAVGLAGFSSSSIKCESEIIQEIVQEIIQKKFILKKLNDSPPSDNSNLVGTGSKIKEIESLLCLESKTVCRIGIWGIGGIGKTTLAVALFDKISDQFEGSCFIDNIREESEKHGLRCLRQELLSTILGDENVNLSTTISGRTFKKKRPICKKLLVVFDDVTDFEQLEYLIGDLDCFGSGSRIIITTRDKQVLRNCSVDQIYEVKELSHCEALNLFCRHAFRQNHPTDDYSLLLEIAVRYARGVPLALKVLGSFLLDKKIEVWRSAMDKLKRIPHMNVQKVLRITYDGLDDETQNIFLDIACFFKGKDVGLVKEFLDACGFFTEIGISTVIDKSMLTISNDNKIMMHDLLQAMGWEIVRQESIENPGKRSRLWHHEDIYHVLTKNTGTEKIEGISLDLSKTREIYLDRHAFVNMHRLRFLKFYNSRYEEDINKVHICPGLETNFTELRYLHWYGYPMKSLSNINLQNLVTLEMPYSNVEQLWSGIQYLCRLKEIDLSCSRDLTSLPDFLGFPNLKSLILVGCTSLREISSSIQTLHKLDFLDLTDCKSLEYLPNCVNLESLRKLYLSGCSSLKILPEIASNIEELYLDETAIEELPSSIEYLCRLVLLDVKSCSRLKSLPNNVCNWKSLKRLNLSDCSQLASLPNEIGSLESLMELEAEGTAIREVPASIKCLNNLNMLSFRRYYTDQETVSLLLPPLLDLHHLRELDLTNCGIMKIPDSLCNLSSLKRLYLCKNNFESIPTAIINLSNLSELNICNCVRLQNLPVLPLISIDAHGCTSLEALFYLSIVGTPVSKDQPFIFVNFANSVKLDWNVHKDILEDALLQMQHLATLWKQNYYDKEWDMMPRACICYPGSEVPDWFHFQNMGSFINVELPRNLFSRNFVGFALCVVVAFRDLQDYDWGLVIDFECKGQCVPDSTLASNTSTCGLPCYFNSDHVFIGFDFHLYPSIHIGESCQNNEVSFQFYLKRLYDGNKIECCKITKCGVRLMYAQELGKSNGSVSLCEEIDEPHSKRCKYLSLHPREK